MFRRTIDLAIFINFSFHGFLRANIEPILLKIYKNIHDDISEGINIRIVTNTIIQICELGVLPDIRVFDTMEAMLIKTALNPA